MPEVGDDSSSERRISVRQWTAPPSDDPTDVERFEAASREAQALADSVEGPLDSGNIEDLTLHQLIHLKNWSTLSAPADAPKRSVADNLLIPALGAFQRRFPESRLALFPIGAVFLPSPGARLQLVWMTRAIRFDTGEARVVIERIEELTDLAHEWWPDAAADERSPHINRMYELATTAFSAVAVENARPRHDGDEEPRLGSESYRNNIEQAHERLDRAERLLDAAGQRTATARYGRGMVWGTLLVAVIAAVMAVVLELAGEDPAYALPLLAGAIGAVVSVLQRMTTTTFRLDLESGHLVAFGAVRPFVGGVFGMLVFALLEANLLNLTPEDGSRLALYGVLAFAAGFNERFAQDSLTSSMTSIPRTTAAP